MTGAVRAQRLVARRKAALRRAAVAWTAASTVPAADAKDSVFKRVDGRLLRAAVRYVDAVESMEQYR